MSLVASSVIAATAAMGSRILGFVRDVLLAQVLGAGPAADAFLAAFRIPGAVRRIVGEGGLNPAFVPLYARLRAEDAASAKSFACEAFSGLVLVLGIATAITEILAAGAVLLLFPGLSDGTADLAVLYLRLAFPLVIGATLAAFLSAVLNAERKVAAAALAPLAVNALLIASLVWIERAALDPAEKGFWLAATTGLSGFLHLTLVALAARRSIPWFSSVPWFSWRRPVRSPQVRAFLSMAAPTVAAAGATQIFILAGTFAASFLPSAVSWLYYADKLFQLPLGLVGAAAGLALLPEIAACAAVGDKAACIEAQNRALEISWLVSLPAAAALMLLAYPMAKLFFERGAFTSADTAGVALALGGLAASLPIAAAGKVLSQTMFAAMRPRVAVWACGFGIIVTISLAGVLAEPLGIVGVCIAIGAGIVVHASMSGFSLWLAGLWCVDARLIRRTCAAMAATIVMGGGLWMGLQIHPPAGWVSLSIYCFGGFTLYAGTAVVFGAVYWREIVGLLDRRRTHFPS